MSTEPSYDVNLDTRERILSRLETVLSGLGMSFARNDAVISDADLPRIIMLDGDETTADFTFGRGRPPYGPNLATAVPEIYITVADTPDALYLIEVHVRNAVLADTELASLCTARYLGNDTGTAVGRQAYTQMSMEFAFDYALKTPSIANTTTTSGGATKREMILARLLSIAQQTEGVASAVRNEQQMPDDPSLYPRVLLLDGSEMADPAAWYRGRPSASPNRAVMSPELYITLMADDVGPALNRVRLMLLSGILNDSVLQGLALDQDIRYGGCQTALGAGRDLTGEMGLVINITRPI